MKDNNTKLAFIKARAEGKSFTTIGKELGISKATCSSWEASLKDQIETLRGEHLEELYTSYGMIKEARINKLGSLLTDIDTAIASKDFSELPLDRLLELRLKYGRELQTEYKEPPKSTDNTLDGLLEEYNNLYRESESLTASEIRTKVNLLEAKKDLLYKIAREKEREEEDSLNINLNYTSKLIRHEEEEAS